MRALIILILWLAVTGWIFYTYSRWRSKRRIQAATDGSEPAPGAAPKECSSHGGLCCGLHAICEKGLPKTTEDLYFDDEELDRFRGRKPEEYNEAEIDEFRQVMLTMLPDELGLWARCLGMRGVSFPVRLRDELLMLMKEADA